MVKRFAVFAIAASVAAVSVTAVLAQPTATKGSEVTWTLNRGQCVQLPVDLSVTGTGTRIITHSVLKKKGKRLEVSIETITGTATDSAGDIYTFDYHFGSTTSGKSRRTQVLRPVISI